MKNSIEIITLIAIITVCMSAVASAAVFDVQVAICRPSWFCTAYSQSSCGDRICIDTNGCGSNLDKPAEYLQCQAPSSGGGSGESSGGLSGGGFLLHLMPSGYFTLGTDLIRVSTEQEKVIQKIISINSSAPGEYNLEIQYPSSYTKGTDFISTSTNSKHIEVSSDFNVIIDTRNILVGTYVIPLRIYNNDNYSRTTILIVDVIPKNNPIIKLNLDSNIKTLGVDKSISVDTAIGNVKINPGDKLTYSIIDPKGNVLLTEDDVVENPADIKNTITFPEIIDEGYYTLAMSIESSTGTYTKSEIFTVLKPNKYLPVIQNPKNVNPTSNIIIWIMVIIIAAVTLINTGLFYKSYKAGRHKSPKGITMFKLSVGKPSIKISLGGEEGMKRLTSRIFGKTKSIDTDRKLELLKKSYERGFISLKEYRDALKDQGYTVESNKVAEYYDELKSREKVEGVSTRNKKTEDKDKEEVGEEQKKAMEKARAEVIRQEEQLKIELERETERKEREERKKEERHKAEIETQKEEKRNPVEQFVEKTVINPLASIIKKESVIDRRSEDRAFILEGGQKLYSIRDLLDTLPHMSEYVLHHHTKHGRNDFANWIGDVFHYDDLAQDIKNTDTKEDMIKVIEKFE